MNKYQKALNFLDFYCEVRHVEQQELLQELVDRATPKKAIEKHQFNDNLYCPNCESCVYEFYMKREQWCSECGQKLDWTDTD